MLDGGSAPPRELIPAILEILENVIERGWVIAIGTRAGRVEGAHVDVSLKIAHELHFGRQLMRHCVHPPELDARRVENASFQEGSRTPTAHDEPGTLEQARHVPDSGQIQHLGWRTRVGEIRGPIEEYAMGKQRLIRCARSLWVGTNDDPQVTILT